MLSLESLMRRESGEKEKFSVLFHWNRIKTIEVFPWVGWARRKKGKIWSALKVFVQRWTLNLWWGCFQTFFFSPNYFSSRTFCVEEIIGKVRRQESSRVGWKIKCQDIQHEVQYLILKFLPVISFSSNKKTVHLYSRLEWLSPSQETWSCSSSTRRLPLPISLCSSLITSTESITLAIKNDEISTVRITI